MNFINVNKDKKPHVQNEISDEAKELYRLKAMNYSTSYENACIGQGELFYDKESESNPQAQQCNSYRFKYRYSTEVEIDGSVEKVGVEPDPKRVGPASWNLEYG